MDVLAELGNLTARLRQFNTDLVNTMQDIILEYETVIVDMNAEEQLYEQGITSYGVSIASYAPYSELTIQIKEQKGQPTNRVTLRDEGDFEGSFFVKINPESFEVKAGDWKTEDLTRQYGDEILGLTVENINEFVNQYLFPRLQKALLDAIQ